MGVNFVWRSLKLNSRVGAFQYFYMQLFSLLTNDAIIASYADDNTPYVTSWKPNLAIEKLEQCSDSLFAWFQNNGMKADTVINVIVSEYQ